MKARVTVTLKSGILDPQGKAIEGALKSKSLRRNGVNAQGRPPFARAAARDPRFDRSRRLAAAPPKTPLACWRRPECRDVLRAALTRPGCASRRRKSADPLRPALRRRPRRRVR